MRGIYNRRGKYGTNDLQDDQVVIVINAPGELIIQPGHPQHLTCTRYQGYCNIIMVTTGVAQKPHMDPRCLQRPPRAMAGKAGKEGDLCT